MTNYMTYYAHVSEDGRKESVIRHLTEMAELAASFAEPFEGEKWAYIAGLVHDIGKQSPEFQKRILENGPKVDHSTRGAELLYKKGCLPLAYCAAGHHAGLPDGGSFAHTCGPTLYGRLNDANLQTVPQCDVSNIALLLPSSLQPPSWLIESQRDPFSVSFFTRMLFSCLVDADFLCTERFMNNEDVRNWKRSTFSELSDMLEQKIQSFRPSKSKLGDIRCKVADECLSTAAHAPGFFTLTVPTGGGKTLSSMRFALNHILNCSDKFRRVIYAIPYTSIIEQNAQVFRDLFGEENIIEVHSGCDVDDDQEDGLRMRLASENWDAPIVFTTNVQFFESLFANKTSRCRKLHNIAGSVIVLDEAQMLPIERIESCIRALVELVKHYNCSVVLCTATQPALNNMIEEHGLNVREIMSNPDELKQRLKRVEYENLGKLSDDELVSRLPMHKQSLCIVNSRLQAKSLFKRLKGEGGVFHLSTSMHSLHRRRILSEIRRRLSAIPPEPCTVISTSLIEAGVDVDFPVVYRALAGMDSIIQSAGRCNREGRNLSSESVVYLFESSEDYGIPRDVRERAAITESILMNSSGSEGEGRIAIEEGRLVHEYFEQVNKLHRTGLDKGSTLKRLGEVNLKVRHPSIPFDEIAKSFVMLDTPAITLIVQCDDNYRDVENLKGGYADVKAMRRLYQYGVNVYPDTLKALAETGKVELANGVWVLVDESCYNDFVGIEERPDAGEGLFW